MRVRGRHTPPDSLSKKLPTTSLTLLRRTIKTKYPDANEQKPSLTDYPTRSRSCAVCILWQTRGAKNSGTTDGEPENND